MGAASRREGGVRGRVAALAGLAVLLCWLAIGAANARAGGPCVGCSGTWTGEWSGTFKRFDHHGGEPNGFSTISAGLKWTATLVSTGGENVWTLASASGGFSISGSGELKEDCTTTLSPGLGAVVHGESFWAATSPGKGLSFEDQNEYETVIMRVPFAWGQPSAGGSPLQSSNGSGGCKAQSISSIGGLFEGAHPGGSGCHYDATAGTNWIAFPNGSSHTETDTCAVPDGEDGFTDSWSGVSYSAQVTLTAPGRGPGGPPVGGRPGTGAYGPWFPVAKREARDDMRDHAIPNATRYCLPYAGGLVIAGAGVLVVGTGGFAGGTLAAAGSLTAAATLPWCLATLKRVEKDMKTYRDPPLASIHVLADPHPARAPALPSCARRHGAVKRFCTTLRSAYASLDDAAANLAADAAAIEETVSRENAAALTSNSAAGAEQDAHLGILLTTLKAERAREATAGRAVASALKSGHVEFRLSRRQSAKLVAAVSKQFSKRGVTKDAVERVLESPLRAKATDLRADLGRL